MNRVLSTTAFLLATLVFAGVALWNITGGMWLAPMPYGEKMVESTRLWLATFLSLVVAYSFAWAAFARK
jgi:hypothetical protein